MSETAKERPWASLTLREMSALPAGRRKQIANWLRKQADFLLKEGKNLSKEYRARFNRV